jgi:multimeric flavodoxin WrbA
MKATILVGTLKKDGLSNTATLSEFLARRLENHAVECTLIRLVDRTIPAGTYSDMGGDDEWPEILEQLIASDIIIAATPIWWNNHSSLIQRVVERLDELHDKVMDGQPSPLEGKVGGIVITGDSDGAQTIIGQLSNFFSGIGLLIPPYATLSVLWEGQRKGADTGKQELMQKYEADYAGTADKMVSQLLLYAGQAGG